MTQASLIFDGPTSKLFYEESPGVQRIIFEEHEDQVLECLLNGSWITEIDTDEIRRTKETPTFAQNETIDYETGVPHLYKPISLQGFMQSRPNLKVKKRKPRSRVFIKPVMTNDLDNRSNLSPPKVRPLSGNRFFRTKKEIEEQKSSDLSSLHSSQNQSATPNPHKDLKPPTHSRPTSLAILERDQSSGEVDTLPWDYDDFHSQVPDEKEPTARTIPDNAQLPVEYEPRPGSQQSITAAKVGEYLASLSLKSFQQAPRYESPNSQMFSQTVDERQQYGTNQAPSQQVYYPNQPETHQETPFEQISSFITTSVLPSYETTPARTRPSSANIVRNHAYSQRSKRTNTEASLPPDLALLRAKTARKSYRQLDPNMQSTITYTNGVYKGEVEGDQEHGFGELTLTDGTKISGEFANGVKVCGVYQWSNGQKYKGEFIDGELTGYAERTYEDGQYKGYFLRGLRHGEGTSEYLDRSKYVGDWVEGLQHGLGEFDFPNGIKYIGRFENNLPMGDGVYQLSNGDRITGQFVAGKLHGQATYVSQDGTTVQQMYENGVRVQLDGKGK